MNLNKTKFFDTDEVYISSRMNEYLKKNFGYEIAGDLESLREAKASLEVTKAELKDEYMSAKYVENMLMIETIKSLLKAHGSDRKTSIIKEEDSNSDINEYPESVNEEDVTVDNEGNIAGYLDYIDECIDQINHDNLSEMAYRIQNAVDDIRTRELDLKASLIRDKFNEIDTPDDEVLLNKAAEWIYSESTEPISEIEHLLKKADAVGQYMDAVEYENIDELPTKVAQWIYHESTEPISEIEHLLKKADAVGEYEQEIEETKESIEEGDEEKGPEHYRWKNDSQLSIAKDKLIACMAQLDHAIDYRAENSHLFFNGGDKAGTGDLYSMKDKLEKLHDTWDEQTEYYGM